MSKYIVNFVVCSKFGRHVTSKVERAEIQKVTNFLAHPRNDPTSCIIYSISGLYFILDDELYSTKRGSLSAILLMKVVKFSNSKWLLMFFISLVFENIVSTVIVSWNTYEYQCMCKFALCSIRILLFRIKLPPYDCQVFTETRSSKNLKSKGKEQKQSFVSVICAFIKKVELDTGLGRGH